MAKFGLIGKKLSHSFSPQIHSFISDYEYKLYEMEENEIEKFINETDIDGFNVTIPHKKAVIPFLDFLSDEAKNLGAVNTVVRKGNLLYGYNTDYFGFDYTLNRISCNVSGKKCLVLGGNGGAGGTVCAVLRDKGAEEVISVSRSGNDNYQNIYTKHSDAEVIINATPVGMYPNCGKSPVELSGFPKIETVIDLIYNPYKTKLLSDAEELKIRYSNGLPMLVSQAYKSAEYFTGKTFDKAAIESIVKAMAKDSLNITLIGMAGVGKTTIGKKLADMLGRNFRDTDELIESKSGKKCSDIIKTEGETAFRKIESEIISELSNIHGEVISCGGGVVTVDENYLPLKQNSIVIFLRPSDPSLLPIKNRPLSAVSGPEELYKARLPLYKRFSDTEYTVTGNVQFDSEQIVKLYINNL